MKKLLSIILLMFVLAGCSENSHIPNTSIIDEIPTSELSEILDYEKSHVINYGDVNGFEELYPAIRKVVSEMSEIDRAKYVKLTYRELVNTQIAVSDSTLNRELEAQWEDKYESYLPQAKQIAKDLENEITQAYRMAAFQSNNYSFGHFRNWLRSTGYNKYLSSSTLGVQYITEDSWNYENIIKDKIDSDFDSESNWVAMKILESIKDKYPLGYEFFLQRHMAFREMLDEYMDNL